jgi:hypothetical protein
MNTNIYTVINHPHFNNETIKKFNNDCEHSIIYDINKFNLIKELGYPKISPIIERQIIRNDLYQQYLKTNEYYKYFNESLIHWIILDNNNQCNCIIYLEFKLHVNNYFSDVEGLIETIGENPNNIELKNKFIEHFFLDITNQELQDSLEEWDSFEKIFCNIIFYSSDILKKITKQLTINS